MVETITPVVYGGNRRRWAGAVVLMTLGATASGALLGALLGLAGAAAGAPWGKAGFAAAAIVAAAYLLREVAGLKVPLVQARRQVPEWWRTFFSPYTAAALYGTGLGIGFFTYVSFGTLVAVAALVVTTGDAAIGALALGSFGLARGLTVTLASRATTGESIRALVDRIASFGRTRVPSLANAAALFGVGAVAAVLTVRISRLGLGEFATAILVFAFGWAAVSKAFSFAAWREALRAYRLPDRLRRTAAFAVPVAEASVPAAALAGFPRVAAWTALFLLAIFSAAIVRAKGSAGRLPCGCFGGNALRDYRWMLARNAVLGAFAIAALARPSPAREIAVGPPEALPILLATTGIAVVVWAVRSSSAALRGETG
ncbi:MAG: MauE/DoxX family redox-associated membrane protein [Actinomycetota bacterium]